MVTMHCMSYKEYKFRDLQRDDRELYGVGCLYIEEKKCAKKERFNEDEYVTRKCVYIAKKKKIVIDDQFLRTYLKQEKGTEQRKTINVVNYIYRWRKILKKNGTVIISLFLIDVRLHEYPCAL